MKLTLHIDDNHAPLLIQLLGTLLAKSSPVEGNEDPAPGHPELPLQDTDEADLRWGVAGELDEEEPAPVNDPTLRDLPLPEWCPPLPELPEGKTRWVCRGTFEEIGDLPISARSRHVRYAFEDINTKWCLTETFGTHAVHIEAI